MMRGRAKERDRNGKPEKGAEDKSNVFLFG